MAQFLRPDSNVTQTQFNGGFAEIDETTASDADFAYGNEDVIARLEVGLSNPAATPGAGTTTIRYRIAKVNNDVVDGGGLDVFITCGVYEGAALVAADTQRTATGTWTQYSFTPDMSGVTDWNDLRLRFDIPASGGTAISRRGGAISWAEVEAPDAGVTMAADAGSFTLTGGDVTFSKTYVLGAETGSFALTGSDANLEYGRVFSAESGAFTLTGSDATLHKGFTLAAEAGAFVLTGSAATLTRNVPMIAEGGSFTLRGRDIRQPFIFKPGSSPPGWTTTTSTSPDEWETLL